MKLTHLTSRGGVVLACIAAVVARCVGSLGAGRDRRVVAAGGALPVGRLAGDLRDHRRDGPHDRRTARRPRWLCWNGAKGDVARAGFVLEQDRPDGTARRPEQDQRPPPRPVRVLRRRASPR